MEDNTQNERQGGSVTPPVNTEHLVNPPPPAGLSAEDVQRIATAVAALLGRPGASGNSKNPLVSGGPQQVPVPPSAGDDDVVLPVDPSLHSTFTANLPPLTGNETSNIDFSKEVNKQSASVVLSEGLPPISTKLLEKIQQWEFVDLTSLLSGDPSTSAKNDTVTLSHEGQQIVVVDPQSQPSRRKRQIVDLPTWIQAFSIYAAGLAAASSTTKEQVMGLMAHMFLMVQLSRDLGGNHWLQYDKDFREWAAAKNLKVWGELNLTIYGRCLAMHQRPMLAPRSDTSNRSSEKRAKSQ